jgi:hypothetical protein
MAAQKQPGDARTLCALECAGKDPGRHGSEVGRLDRGIDVMQEEQRDDQPSEWA